MPTDASPFEGMRLLVLCGGKGQRLRPLTERIPKALVPLHGKPIVDHVVDFFVSNGLHRTTFCIGYKGEMIREHYADSPHGQSFSFCDSGEQASMLRRLHDAAERHDEDEFMVAYCDTFVDLPLHDLCEAHRNSGAAATMITASIQNPFGIVTVDDSGLIRSFVEKPVQKYFIGTFIIAREALRNVPGDQIDLPDAQGLVTLFQTLVSNGNMHSYHHDGAQITFNTESERAAAERDLLNFYTLREQDNES